MEILFGIGRKHCGQTSKCWLPAFSPFPIMSSKGFFVRVVKSGDCGKELREEKLFSELDKPLMSNS